MIVGADVVAQASIAARIARHVDHTTIDESALRVAGCKIDVIDIVDVAKRHGGHWSY